MDLLPDLALLELFSLLSAEERFSTLRLVCRRWKQVVEFQSQNDLVVYQDEHPFKCRWPSNNRQVDLLHTVGKRFFDFSLANDHCKQIKRMFLRRIDWNSIERKWLMKCLGQLEELSIDQTTWWEQIIGDENWTLDLDGFNLPSLRVFSVKQRFAWSLESEKKAKEKASIYAPKLEKLIIWDLHFKAGQRGGLPISLSHPEQLNSLQCLQIDKETGAFVNLEQLTTQHVRRDFDLSKHRKLKRLNLCLNCHDGGELPLSYSSNYHETTGWLITQKGELKLDHLEITDFGGKHLNVKHTFKRSCRFLNSFSFDAVDLDHFTMNCTIDYLPWRIQFVPLAWHPKGLSERHLSRLNIDSVTLYDYNEPDPNLVIKFLVQVGGVKLLQISKCAFSREFYDQLSTVPYLSFLPVNGALPITDFAFVYRISFPHRLWLRVERYALDEFWVAFKRAKIPNFFIWIFGRLHERQIVLENKRNGQVDFRPYLSKSLQFDSLDEAFVNAKKRCDFPHEN